MIAFVFLLSLTTAVLALPMTVQVSGPEARLVTEGCGVTKSCFQVPAGCQDNACTAAVSVLESEGTYTFEMLSVGGVYIAVGLSDDAIMGNDSVVECVRSTSAPGTVDIFMSFNAGHSNHRVPTDGVTLLEGSYVGTTVYCKFTRQAVTTVEDIQFDVINTEYHLLLAAGSRVLGGGLLIHDVVHQASLNKRLLSVVGVFENTPAP